MATENESLPNSQAPARARINANATLADKQLFAPVPLRAMALDLSGLQFRVLICVAAHDRMSLPSGKGQGCRASNDRMKTMVGCNYSRLCSTLSQLVDSKLLKRERLGRHTVYRVVYTDDDRLLFGNLGSSSVGCRAASDFAPIGCRYFPNSDGFPAETPPQYIPLNGEINSEESGEENSLENAHFAARGTEDFRGSGEKASRDETRGRLQRGVNVGGEMARLERAISIGAVVDRVGCFQFLQDQIGDENPNNSGRATRLAERLIEDMDDAEYQRCCEAYGWEGASNDGNVDG